MSIMSISENYEYLGLPVFAVHLSSIGECSTFGASRFSAFLCNYAL